MKNTGSKKMKVMIAASAAVAIPMFADPAFAQIKEGIQVETTKGLTQSSGIKTSAFKFTYCCDKMPKNLSIAGIDGTHTIFKRTDGTMFYLDPQNLNIIEVSKHYTIKLTNANLKEKGSITQKGREDACTIVGVDSKSNVVFKNNRDEMFTIDQKTGDFVYVPDTSK